MSFLLAFAAFALLVAVSYFTGLGSETEEAGALSDSRSPEPALLPALAPAIAVAPVWVAGYQIPDELHYHRGHTWAHQVGPDTVVVGLDDFARQLIGQAEGLELPPVGSRLRQGAPGFAIHLDGRSASLLAPVGGEVIERNSFLARQPGLATEEPYGRGWIMKVRSTDLPRYFRNLVSGSAAHTWIEESRKRMELQLMALSGSVLMDGGQPVADFARHLEDEDWRLLIGEFLLT